MSSPCTPSSTAFVFAGGVSHPPVLFERIIKELNSRGYEAEAIAYPTIGADNKGKTLQDEYQHIRDTTNRIADSGKDVVLVGHSYGGWPASRAVKDADKEARKAAGKEHGVIEIAFFAAFLIPEDADMKFYSYLPPWIDVRVSPLRIDEAIALLQTRESD